MLDLLFRQIWRVVLAVLAVQATLLALFLAGYLKGPGSNLLPQALIGGALLLLLLFAHRVRFAPSELPEPPLRAGIWLLVLVSLALVAVFLYSVWPVVTLPYDLSSWSDSLFVMNVIKLQTGSTLYLPAGDNNTNPYTFGAPVLTYAMARILGQPTSIPVLRLIQLFYLAVCALFAGSAAGHLVRLAAPERFAKLPRAWGLFFVLSSFLFATNSETTAFNIFLHNEPMATMATAIGFWLLLKYSLTQNSRWLWVMALFPTIGFFVKQNLVVWLAVYVVYLWFEGALSLRRQLGFLMVSVLVLGGAIGLCLAVWGEPFRYWIFRVLSEHEVSVVRMVYRFADAGWHIAVGFASGLVLLRSDSSSRLLGIWLGWLILTLGGLYAAGVSSYTIYLGPATLVGGCFLLAAVAKHWPTDSTGTSRGAAWTQAALLAALVLTIFGGLGHPRRPVTRVSADFARYIGEIEAEFEGHPPDRVLLDIGDWIYLRHNVVMKDRAIMVGTHRRTMLDREFLQRVEQQQYDKILVHIMPTGRFLYDLGLAGERRKEVILTYYREVRRIPKVRGMDTWRYAPMTLGEIVVLEPIREGRPGSPKEGKDGVQ